MVVSRFDGLSGIHAVLQEVDRVGPRSGFDGCIFTSHSKDLPFGQSVLARIWLIHI